MVLLTGFSFFFSVDERVRPLKSRQWRLEKRLRRKVKRLGRSVDQVLQLRSGFWLDRLKPRWLSVRRPLGRWFNRAASSSLWLMVYFFWTDSLSYLSRELGTAHLIFWPLLCVSTYSSERRGRKRCGAALSATLKTRRQNVAYHGGCLLSCILSLSQFLQLSGLFRKLTCQLASSTVPKSRLPVSFSVSALE